MFATPPDLARSAAAAATPDPGVALSGDFEVHLTVGAAAADALAAWAAEHELKFTHILLARGAAVSQPMLTLRASGSFEEVAAATRRTADRVAGAGFEVLRVKIEATPWAEGVPQSDAEGARLGPHRYFEHHVKLLLSAAESEAEFESGAAGRLGRLADRHGAHLSRNARRVRPDGLRERFVTQRCRLVGLATAGRRLDALLAELAADGRRTASVEREFVALDTDETLDAGWIDEARPAEHHPAEHRGADDRTARQDTTGHDRQGAPR
ncbi:hypothetical protein [Kitasatospora sp. LaBMicrA B282]|uniref:hypothetical protein n=1 Tax=Kitasatospora sp. LaBMicrA B282 TaxID=3420949 RepID=UPI003D0B60D3